MLDRSREDCWAHEGPAELISPSLFRWLQLVGAEQQFHDDRSTMKQATGGGGGERSSSLRSLLSLLWSGLLVGAVALYLYYNFTELFLFWYGELFEKLEFFTLVVLAFQMAMVGLPGLFIVAGVCRSGGGGGAPVRRLMQTLAEELRKGEVPLRTYRRCVAGMVCVAAGLLVMVAASFFLMFRTLYS